MATFVKLTRLDGPIWVCPDQVCCVSLPLADISPKGANAHILLTGGFTYVVEDVPIVLALLRNPDAKA